MLYRSSGVALLILITLQSSTFAGPKQKNTDLYQVPGLQLGIPDDWGVYQPETITAFRELAAGGVYIESRKNPDVFGTIHQRVQKSRAKTLQASLQVWCNEMKSKLKRLKTHTLSWSASPTPTCSVKSPAGLQFHSATPFPYSSEYFYLNTFTFVKNELAESRKLASDDSVKANASANELMHSLVRSAR